MLSSHPHVLNQSHTSRKSKVICIIKLPKAYLPFTSGLTLNVLTKLAYSVYTPVTNKHSLNCRLDKQVHYNAVRKAYLWQIQKKMFGGADDWSLPADFTLRFLEGQSTMVRFVN